MDRVTRHSLASGSQCRRTSPIKSVQIVGAPIPARGRTVGSLRRRYIRASNINAIQNCTITCEGSIANADTQTDTYTIYAEDP